MASCELCSSAQCQGRPGGTCDDPLTKRIRGVPLNFRELSCLEIVKSESEI